MKGHAAEIFVAQPLLAVRLLLQSTKAHSQEWLCYPKPFSSRVLQHGLKSCPANRNPSKLERSLALFFRLV